ncbi:MAG: hypothetical protein M1814_004013 [Vezdaea aestivalis]|nr:MAG: hypothetical protein M1814_004013 [Vezdaea aestivalis]
MASPKPPVKEYSPYTWVAGLPIGPQSLHGQTFFREFRRDANLPQLENPNNMMLRKNDFVTKGKPVTLSVNSYVVTKIPDKVVYQYAIKVGSGSEKFALVKKIWHSKFVQSRLGRGWLFDMHSLAWSLTDLGVHEKSMLVDLDAEAPTTPGAPSGQPRRTDGTNEHRISFKRTKQLDLTSVKAYLANRATFDNSILEGINFLDHLLRQWPSERFNQIRRSFFVRDQKPYDLGLGLEAFKGVYQSMRLVQGGNLAINADVSNGAFWATFEVTALCLLLCHCQTTGQLIQTLKPVRGKDGRLYESARFNELRRIRRLRVRCHHDLIKVDRDYVIDYLLETDAQTTIFPFRNRQTGVVEEISIEEYFKRQYDIRLKHPMLPIVQTTKAKVKLPMELLRILPGQKYPFKLNEEQTAAMIKFAVTKPATRKANIENGLRTLDWGKDPYFSHYGLEISSTMVQTKARLLQNPTIQYHATSRTVNPGTKGSWNIQGIKFHLPAPPLARWGIQVWKLSKMDNVKVQWFVGEFLKVYKSHGGVVTAEGERPFIRNFEDQGTDGGLAAQNCIALTGNKYHMAPQIVMFIVPDKFAWRYTSIKKTADCRYALPSQVVQAAHAIRAQPQYLSNVAMKFHTKLGGTTNRIGKSPMGHFKVPTAIIGADVSHSAPGANTPSIASMTMSQDLYAARYAAIAQTNGIRTEMITDFNIRYMMLPLLKSFQKKANGGKLPQHIWYFRDGVSEGQHQPLLDSEVTDMKQLLKREVDPNWSPKFIVIVCSKRHHIRFFPKPGDRMGAGEENPYPGVLVERDVTDPHHNDAFLCSHKAIQGTARPCHYHILINETGLSNGDIYTTIYEQCYTFCRSTTPVSLHPAVYYAHLASKRAAAHEQRSDPEQKLDKVDPARSRETIKSETTMLMDLHHKDRPDFKFSMCHTASPGSAADRMVKETEIAATAGLEDGGSSDQARKNGEPMVAFVIETALPRLMCVLRKK